MRRGMVIALAFVLAGCSSLTELGLPGPENDPPDVVLGDPVPAGPGQPGQPGPEAPPPIVLDLADGPLSLQPWSYCFGPVCADGMPPTPLPDVGSPDEVRVAPYLAGWSFESSFVALDAPCGRTVPGLVTEAPDGSVVLEPAGPAGRYDVSLFARGEGDAIVSFEWTTTVDGNMPEPEARLALLAEHDGQVDSYGVELELKNLGTTPADATARITVRASGGEFLTFDATPSDLGCSEGTLYWGGPAEQGLRAAGIGDAPFTYEVEVTLDGQTYIGTANWPADTIEGNEPSVRLVFDPPLPGLS